MSLEKKEPVVISVGGSLIVPDQIDTDFLVNFRRFINDAIVQDNRRFIIIAGGGKTARRYQEAADRVHTLDKNDLDWLGIHATRLNGHLIRTILKDVAHPVMISNPDEILDVPTDVPVVVSAGYRPGCSTDLRAVQIAERLAAKKVINLSNIDYVYTADPRTDQTAEIIKDISWADFRKLIPAEWDPGLSSPFDPIAAHEAEKLNIEVACINGSKLDELQNYLDGQTFIGTKIHN